MLKLSENSEKSRKYCPALDNPAVLWYIKCNLQPAAKYQNEIKEIKAVKLKKGIAKRALKGKQQSGELLKRKSSGAFGGF